MAQLKHFKISEIAKAFLLTIIFVYFSVSFIKAQNFPEENLGWNLSVQTYTFKLFTFEESVVFAKNAGLKTVEVYFGQKINNRSEEMFSTKLSEQSKLFVKDVLDKNGVSIIGFGVVGANSDEEWENLFSFADEMKVQFLNIEPHEKFLPLIGKLANQYKVKVALHNHPEPSHYWHPDVVINALKLSNSPYVGACGDIGHWIRSGLDPIECLKKLEGKLFTLHMKDLNVLGRDGHDVHWGTGVSDIENIIIELKRQKFVGNISCEYEYNWENSFKDVKVSIENFRNFLE